MKRDDVVQRAHRAAKMYAAGRTGFEIARELGVCRRTVFRDLRLAGVPEAVRARHVGSPAAARADYRGKP